jgi:hypothetical protein
MNDTEAMVAPCGTYGAYQRHRKAGEEPCQPCRDANAQYTREFRRSRPELYARELASKYARWRALERLAREHPKRFATLLNEERAKVYMADGGAA